jgi:Fic family protein
MFRKDEQRLAGLARGAASALRAYTALRARPIATIQDLANRSGVSFPTAAKAVEALVGEGVARELTGQRRNRVFAYDEYVKVLNEGAEPLP